jgi:hypothetical protein
MEKSRLGVSAWEIDRTIVRFPDPAIEVVNERFRAHWSSGRRSWSCSGPEDAGWNGRCGSAAGDTCCSPTSLTTGCSVGARSPYFLNRRTTATGTRETGKGDS